MNVFWEYPNIGTAGEPLDTLRLTILRTRAIPDLLIRFDGTRDGYVIGASVPCADPSAGFEFKEIAFIHESKLEHDDSSPSA